MRLHAIHNYMEIKRKAAAEKIGAGKKKYSVQFKRKVVQEYLVDLKTPGAIFEEYGVRAGLLHQWHRWYHEHFVHKSNDASKMKTKKTKTAVTVLELEQELARTRAQLDEEKLKVLALEHLVKLAREHHGIDLKKSTGGR